MYNKHFGLRESPFSIQPDPDFLYFGKRHSLALAMLKYGIVNRSGFVVITGEIGCGKTTLIQYLLRRLGTNVTTGLISYTELGNEDLLRWVLHSFGQAYDAPHMIGLLDELKRFLIKERRTGRRVVLIIDEAQNLGAVRLEELRMLSNLTGGKKPLLQLVLVGQPQLRQLLSQNALAQFAQRVSSDFHITPLGQRETKQYIEHRLAVAGRKTRLFEDAAIARIFAASEGVPRKINVLCDTALVYGFAARADSITAAIVDEMLDDKTQYGAFGAARKRTRA